MAAKITRKNTSKKVGNFVEINYDGEIKTVEILTKKKCFGSVNINEETGNLIGKCITCAKKYNEVAEACTVKSDPKCFEFKAEKKLNAGKNYAVIFSALALKKTAKVIMAENSDLFNTAGACKSFVSTCSSAYKAATVGGTSKMAKHAEWLKNGKNGDAPAIMPKSKRFTEMALAFVAAESVKEPVNA